MELTLSVCLGIGLAAACGFRVFVPLLGLSLAAMAGHVELTEELAWMGAWPAIACFLTATILEIAAYYLPWVDNLLDLVATPAAVVAGAIAMGSVVTDMSPLMRWAVALIAGGGTAGLIQTATATVRGTSTATTAGTANWIFATFEWIASLGATIVSLLMPLVAALVVAMLSLAALLYLVRRSLRNHQRKTAPYN